MTIQELAKKNIRKYYGTEGNFMRDSADADYEIKLFCDGYSAKESEVNQIISQLEADVKRLTEENETLEIKEVMRLRHHIYNDQSRIAELIDSNNRKLKAIENMLIALNQCGPEIRWNTSSYIEAAYAEHKEIYKRALNEQKETRR